MDNVTLKIGKIDQSIGASSPSSIIEHNEYERMYQTYTDSSNLTNAAGVGGLTGQYPDVIGGTPVAGLTSFGNLSTTSQPGIEAMIKVNDMISVGIALFDPDDDESDVVTSLTGGSGTFIAPEETKLPRIDLFIPIRFGNFTFQPGGS
jgi:hypothetical protein